MKRKQLRGFRRWGIRDTSCWKVSSHAEAIHFQIGNIAMVSHSPSHSYVSLRDPGLFAVANIEVAWFSSE